MTHAELWQLQLMAAANTSAGLESQFGEQSLSPNVVAIPVFGIVMGLLIVASVHYMTHVRRTVTGKRL